MDLKVEYRGEDVFKIHVKSSGISYTPLLEWRLAAQWANYTWEGFEALDGEHQSAVVATYRAYHQIEAVLNKITDEKIKASQRGPHAHGAE